MSVIRHTVPWSAFIRASLLSGLGLIAMVDVFIIVGEFVKNPEVMGRLAVFKISKSLGG